MKRKDFLSAVIPVATWATAFPKTINPGKTNAYKKIPPYLKKGENILIAAHGNSLRALMMHLEHIGEDKIAAIDLPTGHPRMYTFDEQMRLVSADYL